MSSLADFGSFARIYLDARDAIDADVTELTVRLAENGAIHHTDSVTQPNPIDPGRLQGASAESCHSGLAEDSDRWALGRQL